MRWHEPERAAMAELRPTLKPFLGLARAAHNFLECAIRVTMAERGTPPGHAAEVQARILTRLSLDLRVVELASIRSYSLPALATAATIYELSHAVAFIGGDSERADKWESHDASHVSYPNARQRKDAVRATLLALVPDIPRLDQAVEQQEELYQAFCVAKHGNPKALRNFGFAVSGDRVQLHYGPFVADYIYRQTRFALCHSARMLIAATIVFADRLTADLDSAKRRAYKARKNRIISRLTGLMKIVMGTSEAA